MWRLLKISFWNFKFPTLHVFYLKYKYTMHTFGPASSEEPDQMPQNAASDQDPHRLHRPYSNFSCNTELTKKKSQTLHPQYDAKNTSFMH